MESHELPNLPAPIERNILFTKQVDQDSISEVTSTILNINGSDARLKKLYKIYDLKYEPKPIKLYIDSYGGNVYQILGLISVIEASATPVHTIVTGCAMSCGFLLLISGHKRFAYPESTVLYHCVSSATWGQIQDLKEDYAETKRLQNKIESMVLKRTKIPKSKLVEIKKRKIDWHIDTTQAKKLGIIDKIL